MAIGDLVNKFLGRKSGIDIKLYECAECDATFESAKKPKRASCPECHSNDVKYVETTDAHT